MSSELSGRRLARNSALNLAGQGLPAIAAVVAVPLLLRYMGPERLGILTLVWALTGYFGLFDLGLGRALTRSIADRRADATERELSGLIWKTLLAMAGIGAIAAVVAALSASWLADDVLDITPTLRADATIAFRLTAPVIPVIIVTAGLRGVLEAFQRFDLVNAARVPLGALNYVVPAVVARFNPSLAAIVTVLVSLRVVALLVHMVMAASVLPSLRSGPDSRVKLPLPLLHTGGWMTVSNVVSPVLVMADRFMLGAVASTAVVAFYTAPLEIVTKLMIVAGSVSTSLFPAIATRADASEHARLYVRALVLTCVGLFPPTIAVASFAPELLRVWLGASFAERASGVLQLLALGVYVNCLAQIAFTLIQGAGRSDASAKLHVAEVPFYLVVAWLLIRERGVEGAALAWTLRVSVDAIGMFVVARRIMPDSAATEHARSWLLILSSVLLAVIGVAYGGASLIQRAVLSLGATMTLLAFAWFGVASAVERRRLRGVIVRG